MRLDQLKKIVLSDLNTETARGQLIRSAGKTAIIKLSAVAITFIASLAYARVLGPEGYGIYSYILAWMGILTIPVAMGLPVYLMREAAKDPDCAHWLRRWADIKILTLGVLMALGICGTYYTPLFNGFYLTAVAGSLLPMLNGLTRIRNSLLRALGLITQSQWPLQIAAPLTALAIFAILYTLKADVGSVDVIAATLVATTIALAISNRQLNLTTAQATHKTPNTVDIKSALPFMGTSGLYLFNSKADLIMLGALNGGHDAGIYAIATSASSLILFTIETANLVIAPRIAKLYYEGDHALLQRLITGVSRRVFIATLPIALILFFAGGWLVDVAYGKDFKAATTPIRILVASQLLAVSFGSVAVILNMSGNEKSNLKGVGIAFTINIILNAILIPFYGAPGAAIATGTCLTLRPLLLSTWIFRDLQLNSTIIRQKNRKNIL